MTVAQKGYLEFK